LSTARRVNKFKFHESNFGYGSKRPKDFERWKSLKKKKKLGYTQFSLFVGGGKCNIWAHGILNMIRFWPQLIAALIL
jgi:hypothetical protein